MTVALMLKTKGSKIVTVKPEATVIEACRVFNEERIGAAPVVDADGRLLGMISERDVVRAIALHGHLCLDKTVESLMTRDLVTARPDESIDDVMSKMTDRRCRHLPVLRSDKMVGLISIGDVVKMRIALTEMEAQELRRYIATG